MFRIYVIVIIPKLEIVEYRSYANTWIKWSISFINLGISNYNIISSNLTTQNVYLLNIIYNNYIIK